MEVAVYIDTQPPVAGKGSSTHFEVMLDPNELESNFCDMLMQVVGSRHGITGVHVDSVQRGGVPVGVVTAALATGWQGLQEQHSKMKPYLDQVSLDERLCSTGNGHSAMGGQPRTWTSLSALLIMNILTCWGVCAHVTVALQTAFAR